MRGLLPAATGRACSGSSTCSAGCSTRARRRPERRGGSAARPRAGLRERPRRCRAGRRRSGRGRAPLATQHVSFCRTTDGVRLAYASSGSGPPLVKASNWLTHLDYDWDSPVWRHWWQALSRAHTLVRYDERGCGLSDWDVDADSFTLDAWVRDLETVVDALGLERFPLLGISQGGPIAITYAARHPERVSHLVVYGTCARATWARADDERRRELAALGELIRMSWGSDQPGLPAGLRRQVPARRSDRAVAGVRRAAAPLDLAAQRPPAVASRSAHSTAREAARRLDVPTLILHADDDQVWSFDEAEELHAMVPGSSPRAIARQQPHPSGRRAGVRHVRRPSRTLPGWLTVDRTAFSPSSLRFGRSGRWWRRALVHRAPHEAFAIIEPDHSGPRVARAVPHVRRRAAGAAPAARRHRRRARRRRARPRRTSGASVHRHPRTGTSSASTGTAARPSWGGVSTSAPAS